MISIRCTSVLTSIFLLFTLATAHSQEASTPGPQTFDHGIIDTGFYINHCLGFSYPIPEGWKVNAAALGSPPGVAKREPGGLILLILDQRASPALVNRMILSATDTRNLNFDTKEFVSRFVHLAPSGPNAWSRKILQEPYPADFAGKRFFRSDFADTRSEVTVYKAYISTKFRGYFLNWTIGANSADELETLVDSLRKLVFYQDEPDPGCSMPTYPAPAPK